MVVFIKFIFYKSGLLMWSFSIAISVIKIKIKTKTIIKTHPFHPFINYFTLSLNKFIKLF